MSVTRVPHSGALVISDIIGGYLVSRTYYGYTVREARAMFRRDTSR